MATCWGRSGTGQDRSLTVLFRTQSEKTGTKTEAGQIKTDLMVRSLAVQSRSKTGLQSVFGPDSWTLPPTIKQAAFSPSLGTSVVLNCPRRSWMDGLNGLKILGYYARMQEFAWLATMTIIKSVSAKMQLFFITLSLHLQLDF